VPDQALGPQKGEQGRLGWRARHRPACPAPPRLTPHIRSGTPPLPMSDQTRRILRTWATGYLPLGSIVAAATVWLSLWNAPGRWLARRWRYRLDDTVALTGPGALAFTGVVPRAHLRATFGRVRPRGLADRASASPDSPEEHLDGVVPRLRRVRRGAHSPSPRRREATTLSTRRAPLCAGRGRSGTVPHGIEETAARRPASDSRGDWIGLSATRSTSQPTNRRAAPGPLPDPAP
jgi:hypothetical protein